MLDINTCLIGFLGKEHEIMFIKTWNEAFHTLDPQTFVFVFSFIIYIVKPLLNNTICIYLPSACYTPTFLCVSSWYMEDVWVCCIFFFLAKENIWSHLNISPHTWVGCKHSCRRLHQASFSQQLPSDIPWSSASRNLPGVRLQSLPFSVIFTHGTCYMPNWEAQLMTCSWTLKMGVSQEDGYSNVLASWELKKCPQPKSFYHMVTCLSHTQIKNRDLKNELGLWPKVGPIYQSWKTEKTTGRLDSIPHLTTNCCLTLGKSFNFSKLQLSEVYNNKQLPRLFGDNKMRCL